MNTCPHCPTSNQKVQFIKQREFVPADMGWTVIDLKKRRNAKFQEIISTRNFFTSWNARAEWERAISPLHFFPSRSG